MTSTFPTLRHWLATAAFGAACAFSVPVARADEPAPATKKGAEPAPEEKPAEEETPEPEKSKGELMFAEAIATIQARHASPEDLAAAIRKARGIFEEVAKLPEADASDEVRARATAFAGRMNMALLSYGSDEEKKELLPALVEKITSAEKLTPAEYSMMGNLLEVSAQIDPKLAEATMAKFKTALETKGDENGPTVLAQLEGVMRRATIVGQKLELGGTTFEGEKFEIADLKGKVVLVDFWATWCPPCRAEHPNMLTNYRKYKDKGFEIVGVSLDQDREALAEFLKEGGDDHWIILHDEKGTNPATEYYAIQGIPTMFLLDEEGVVISSAARGEELTRLLEERWGKVELPEEPAETSEEKEKSDDAKPESAEETEDEAPASDAGEK